MLRMIVALAVLAIAAGCASAPKAAREPAREPDTVPFRIEERRTVKASIVKPAGWDRLSLHERATYLRALVESAPAVVSRGDAESTSRVVASDGYEVAAGE